MALVPIILISLFSWLAVAGPSRSGRWDHSKLAVVSIIDKSSALACLLKVYSILKSTRYPERISFHFLLMKRNSFIVEDWNRIFQSYFPNTMFEAKVFEMSLAHLKLSGTFFETDVIYSRFYLPLVFQDIDKILYLDNDIVVTADLLDLLSFDMRVPVKSKLLPITSFKASMESKMSRSDLVKLKHKISSRSPPYTQQDLIAAPIAFVWERHPIYKDFIKSHFNMSNPLVQSTINIHTADYFLNGGVALFNAALWRRDNWTAKMEAIIISNSAHNIYTPKMGDQGPFYVGFQENMAMLPGRFNLRRLPKKSVHMLTDLVLGVIHLAGTTHGDAELLCREPLRYPIFINAVTPMYLSIVASFQKNFAADDAHPLMFSNACKSAVREVIDEIASSRTQVKYNPGLGNFSWPPQWPLQI